MIIHEIGNEYTSHYVPRFDPYAEGFNLAYNSLIDRLSNSTTRVKSVKTRKKSKSKRRIVKQSRKRNR